MHYVETTGVCSHTSVPETAVSAVYKLADVLKTVEKYELDDQTIEEIEIIEKYEGYIVKQKKEAANQAKLEKMLIPEDIDYSSLDGIRLEAREKLKKVRPLTVGQASRISGVNPADISVLVVYLEKLNRSKNESK